jgi:hypothetical protein
MSVIYNTVPCDERSAVMKFIRGADWKWWYDSLVTEGF